VVDQRRLAPSPAADDFERHRWYWQQNTLALEHHNFVHDDLPCLVSSDYALSQSVLNQADLNEHAFQRHGAARSSRWSL
jgi:hypothetical protein